MAIFMMNYTWWWYTIKWDFAEREKLALARLLARSSPYLIGLVRVVILFGIRSNDDGRTASFIRRCIQSKLITNRGTSEHHQTHNTHTHTHPFRSNGLNMNSQSAACAHAIYMILTVDWSLKWKIDFLYRAFPDNVPILGPVWIMK